MKVRVGYGDRLVVEVKTEIRFRPTEDGKIVPEATNDYKLKPGGG